MPELLTLHAKEESTYVVNAEFSDEDDATVAPSAADWTLQDSGGLVINSRKDVAITIPESSEDIVLSGDDLAFQSAESGEKVLRELSVEYVYSSTLVTDSPGSLSIYFWLDRVGRYKVD